MSNLRKDGTSIYDHFNETSPFSVPFDLDWLALQLETKNYGTVRFLSALARVRRSLLKDRIEKARLSGDYRMAESIERCGDNIAEAIEALLRAGEF